MLRNTTFGVLALFAIAASAQAGVISVTSPKVVGLGSPPAGQAYTSPENAGAGNNYNNLLTGGNTNWVSYALGVQVDPAAILNGYRIGGFDVNIQSTQPGGGFNQRWNFNGDANGGAGGYSSTDGSLNTIPDTTLFVDGTTRTAVNTSTTTGDSHLVTASALFARGPFETRVPKAADLDTTTPGFTTTHRPGTDGTRNYAIGTLMDGAWGNDAATQDTTAAGQLMNFAYIVIPRGYDPSTLQMTVKVQLANAAHQSVTGESYTLTTANFFPSIVPEPATLTLLGLALVGGLGIRRRRS